MPKKIRSHTFKGKRYRVKFRQRPAKASLGSCDDPKSKRKTIFIDPDLKGIDLLYTLLHEAWHAVDWDLSEEAVEQAACDVSRFLWRMGYRTKKS